MIRGLLKFAGRGTPEKAEPGPPTPWGGWRRLGLFWAAVVVVLAAAGTTLQLLGPPTSPQQQATPGQAPSAAQQPSTAAATPAPAPVVAAPTDPNALLRERAPADMGGFLPRVGPDGRRPMQAFATPFNPRAPGPRVALIVAGIGMNEVDSVTAGRTLRGAITFALSPYAGNPERVMGELRSAGHEVLMSIPMEPSEFPLNDPGPRALMTNLSIEDNLARLYWVMSRAGSYVGMTNALGMMRGERLSGMADQIGMVHRELARRGLIFVDVRADAEPNHLSAHRRVDLVIDEVPTEERIDQRLELLSRLARDRGSALGLATQPRPVTIERIAAWTNGLADKGITLAPVTAIALLPAQKEAAK